jgi:uncharacterized membrane protein
MKNPPPTIKRSGIAYQQGGNDGISLMVRAISVFISEPLPRVLMSRRKRRADKVRFSEVFVTSTSIAKATTGSRRLDIVRKTGIIQKQ